MSLSFNQTQKTDKLFIKSYGSKTPFWKYYARCILDVTGFRQPVEYYNKRKRLAFESQTLRLWKKFNLNVPDVIFQDSSELHLSIIQGQTLSSLFEESVDLHMVSIVFRELDQRHQLAFRHNEPRLCHVDANLRNLIYSEGLIFHVDFEMGREHETVELWARREVSKLLISLLQDRSAQERSDILQIFCQEYTLKQVVNSLVLSKLDRSNKKRKHKRSSQYDLYKLAIDLRKRLTITNED